MVVAAMVDTGLVPVAAVQEAMEHVGATYPKPEAGHNHEDHESEVLCTRG
jgi:hypothetical protein